MKCKHAPLARSLSGTLGQVTFQSTRAGPIAKRKPRQPTPLSAAQLAMQDAMVRIAALRSDMHADFQSAWTQYAAAHRDPASAQWAAANLLDEKSGHAHVFAGHNSAVNPETVIECIPIFMPGMFVMTTTTNSGTPTDVKRWMIRATGSSLFDAGWNGYTYGTRATATNWIWDLPGGLEYVIGFALDDGAGNLSATAYAIATSL